MGIGYDSGRNSRHRDALGDIVYDNRAGTYIGIVAYVYIFNQTHTGTNPDIVAYYGRSAVIRPNIKELTEIHIVAYYSAWIYDHAYPMPEIESVTNLAMTGNLH